VFLERGNIGGVETSAARNMKSNALESLESSVLVSSRRMEF